MDSCVVDKQLTGLSMCKLVIGTAAYSPQVAVKLAAAAMAYAC